MSKVVCATWSRTKQSVTRALHQYDYGMRLTFSGFDLEPDDEVEVHFANKGSEDSIVQFGNGSGVLIPDECLKPGTDIDAYVYCHERRCDGETVYHIMIPVIKRARVADTPDDKPVEYIFDGMDASYEDTSPCHKKEYIFDGKDASDT